MNSKFYIDEMLNMDERDEDIGISEVTEFFDKCNILITGGTGFLGKLLIEKLLRTCPNMAKIYIMVRPKDGKTSEERFSEQFDDCLYDRLKKEQPNFASHVVMIEGDTQALNLGLSSTTRELIVKNTHIVFHGAATVRFDESIRKVVEINVRGTKMMLLLAKEMQNLKAFVYISTAYSHCHLDYIEEKYYKPAMEVDKVLHLVEMLDDDLLEHMKTKLIEPWPNTYAFSKALGEDAVRLYSSNLPVCVVRPSIVISTMSEPLCGWTNNMYGATGVTAGAYACVLRVLQGYQDNIAEIIPADYVINNIIVSAWDIDKTKKKEDSQGITLPKEPVKSQTDEPPIYNVVSSCQNPICWDHFLQFNQTHGTDVISTVSMWYHVFYWTRYQWSYNILTFFLHVIPGIIVDAVARLKGREPILFKTYQKIHKFSGVLTYFTTRQWKWNNDNVMELWKKTSSIDRKKFNFNVESLNWETFCMYQIRGIRVYLIKEPMSTLEKARAKYRLLKKLHYTTLTLFWILLAWAAISIWKTYLAVLF